MKTLVVNAFGGAGAGKTTASMHIVSELKKRGYITEYVSEYAKELVWEERYDLLDGTLRNQQQLLAEQQRRIDRLIGKVEIVVTDSPLLLNSIYLSDRENKEAYSLFVLRKHLSYNNFNLVVKRDSKKFEQEGRIHNLAESIQKDNEIESLLKKSKLYYGTYTHSQLGTVVKNIETTYAKLKYGNTLDLTDECVAEALYSFFEQQDVFADTFNAKEYEGLSIAEYVEKYKLRDFSAYYQRYYTDNSGNGEDTPLDLTESEGLSR